VGPKDPGLQDPYSQEHNFDDLKEPPRGQEEITMPVTTEQLDKLIVFDGEAKVPTGYNAAGEPNAWEILDWPERGGSWDEVASELGPQELGRWVGTLTVAHTGNPEDADLIIDKLAKIEPPIEGPNYIAYRLGVYSVPGMSYYAPVGGKQ
jgi:hypothetical protein